MLVKREFFPRIRSCGKIIFIISLSVFALLYGVYFICSRYDIQFDKFTCDPPIVFHYHPFAGSLSYAGILLWCATVAVCLFSAVIAGKKGQKKEQWFLLFFGLLTLAMLVDDLFMFHDFVFPEYFHVPQEWVYLVYLIIIMIYSFVFYRIIFRTDYILLMTAFVFFALSLFYDIKMPQRGIANLFEDGFKLCGIVHWFVYFVRSSFGFIV